MNQVLYSVFILFVLQNKKYENMSTNSYPILQDNYDKLNTLNKGLSKKGKRINVPCDNNKIKNISLLCALTTEKIIYNEMHETNVNGIIFMNFIQNIINKLTEPNYCFIFDNVRFHHNKLMLKLIKDNGYTYMFTPPYSHFLFFI